MSGSLTAAGMDRPRLLRRRIPLDGWQCRSRNTALLLVDGSGQITGGYLAGKQLSAADAQVQLCARLWEELPQLEATANPWNSTVPDLEPRRETGDD